MFVLQFGILIMKERLAQLISVVLSLLFVFRVACFLTSLLPYMSLGESYPRCPSVSKVLPVQMEKQ